MEGKNNQLNTMTTVHSFFGHLLCFKAEMENLEEVYQKMLTINYRHAAQVSAKKGDCKSIINLSDYANKDLLSGFQ